MLNSLAGSFAFGFGHDVRWLNIMRLRVASVVAVVFLAGCLAGRAQPLTYTLNLRPGYNAIANPLLVSNNSVNALFPVMPAGTMLAKFNRALGGFELNNYDPALGGWEFDSGFAGTLAPGEGAFLYVPVPIQLTISGEKHDPFPQLGAGYGFNLVGCQSLNPCSFEELMGFAPRVGDEVYQYDDPLVSPPGGGTQPATRTNRFLASGWNMVPVLPPLRGFFVNLANSPRVLIDPPRLNVPLGGVAQFNAVTIGEAPPGFQWRFNGAPIPAQNGPTLRINNTQPPAQGNYSVVVQFSTGSVTSLNARLTVVLPPVFTKQPQSLTVTQGGTADFFAQASGTPPLFYQWQTGTSVVQPFGQDKTNFFIPNVQPSAAGPYFVIATNLAGAATSEVAFLTVLVPPTIFAQPQNQTVNPGQTVTLSVLADGTQPLTYQWLLNGNLIADANGPSLTINGVRPDQSGIYRVIVANAAGAVMSQEAMVMVLVPDFVASDMFSGPGFINTPNGFLQASNVDATTEPGEPRHAAKPGARSVWLNYVSSQPGIVTIRTLGSSFDTLLAAYVGDNFTNLVEVASDDDRGGFLSSVISFSVTPGVIYRIAIAGHGGGQGKFILNWNFEPTTERLAVIAVQPVSAVVPIGGMATFGVGAQTAVDGYQWFFNNQPITGATQPLLRITNAQPAHVGSYFVRVRIGNRTVESRVVDLELREADGPGQPPQVRAYDKLEDLLAALDGQPPGIRFNPASQVLGYTGSQTFSTAGSGGQNGEPIHCGVVGGHSKWYAYIPPTNGTLYLNTDGSNFDTLLAVYTGCCTFATLTPVNCDNNSGTNGLASSLNFPATMNTVYYIAVDGVGGVTGSVKLNYRLLVSMMLTNLASTTNSLTFRLNATPSWPFSVQRSTNCLSWTNFLISTTASGLYLFTDTNLPPGRRFYRALQAP